MTERRPEPNQRGASRRRAATAAAIALWGAAVGVGLTGTLRYHASAGAAAAATASPADASLVSPGRASLVLFLHPQCPCSRATLDAVEQLVATNGDKLSVTAVFADVGDGAADASAGPIWTRAASIAGVRIVRDADGAIARRFDAQTSGQAMCYRADGTLAYAGGLTSGRGMTGDSDGARAVAAIVAGQVPRTARADVFGCELQ